MRREMYCLRYPCGLVELMVRQHLPEIIQTSSTTKKVGLPLGTGSPERRVPLSVSFSHRRVGSSILASLSEAGGNDLQKMMSKPLPPRSPLLTSRHVKNAPTLRTIASTRPTQ